MINEKPCLLEEAEAAAREIAFGVESASVFFSSSPSVLEVTLNIATLEGDSFVVSLTERGFTVVEKKTTKDVETDRGKGTDSGVETVKERDGGVSTDEIYENGISSLYIPSETIHALMDQLSPRYRAAFGNSLAAKLATLTG